MPVATNTTAATYESPKTAQPAISQTAVPQRARETGPNHRRCSARRCATRDGPIPVTRTSLPAAAVVAVANRCVERRRCWAVASSTRRSTAGRHEALSTVGSAKTTSSASRGSTDTSSATVTTSRSTQPHVEKTDMYMWSSTKIWWRSTESRSRWSRRSWCSMLQTPACSPATCVSSAMVTLSRNRRVTRLDTIDSSHVSTTAAAIASAARSTVRAFPATAPSARNFRQRAIRASGTAATIASTRATTINAGSWV